MSAQEWISSLLKRRVEGPVELAGGKKLYLADDDSKVPLGHAHVPFMTKRPNGLPRKTTYEDVLRMHPDHFKKDEGSR